jgi:hypothetical protein
MDRLARHPLGGSLLGAVLTFGLGGAAVLQAVQSETPRSTFWTDFGVGCLVVAAVALMALIVLATKWRRAAPDPVQEAKAACPALISELGSIDGVAREALETGNWWNVNFTVLGHPEWDRLKDRVALEPGLHTLAAKAVQAAEALNRAANEKSEHGSDPGRPIAADARGELENLRTAVADARAALDGYCGLPVSRGLPAIRHSLDGDPSMRVLLRPGAPQTVLLESGFQNPNRTNLDGLSVNILFSEGVKVCKCDREGNPSDKGAWTTTGETWDDRDSDSPKEYWMADGLSLAGTGSLVMPIKLRLTRPGNVFVKSKMYGGELPSDAVRTQTIEVIEASETDLPGRVAELISVAERAAAGPETVFGDPRHEEAHGSWIIMSAVVADELEERDREWLKEKLASVNTPGSGSEWKTRHARESLPHLYELRRRLARGP